MRVPSKFQKSKSNGSRTLGESLKLTGRLFRI